MAQEPLQVPTLGLYHKFIQPNNLFKISIGVGVFLLILTPLWGEQLRIYWLGFSLAFFGWFFGSAIQLKINLTRHTFDLILRSRFEREFLDSVKTFRENFPSHDLIPSAKAKEIFEGATANDRELRKAIGFLLNYYEILAIMVYHKGVDEDILKQYFYDIVLDYYEQTKNFIPLYQEINNSAFIYFVDLRDKWKKEGYI